METGMETGPEIGKRKMGNVAYVRGVGLHVEDMD